MKRRGLTLLEVLVSMAIFLMALIGIGHLISFASDSAVEIQQKGQAVQLCQSQLAKTAAGITPLQSQSDLPCDEDPDWNYTLNCEQDSSIQGLWNVQVTVSRTRADGSRVEASMCQLILDPSIRGSTADTSPSPGDSNASTSNASNPSASTDQNQPSASPGAGGATARPGGAGGTGRPGAGRGPGPGSGGGGTGMGGGTGGRPTGGATGGRPAGGGQPTGGATGGRPTGGGTGARPTGGGR